MILPPFIGVLAYLIVEHDGIAQRKAEQAQQELDTRIREVATSNGGGAASQIEKAAELLQSERSRRRSSISSRPRRWPAPRPEQAARGTSPR